MTALPSTLPDIDTLVKQNRALTPPSVTESRKVPRASISELNNLDRDTIRDRYLSHGFDDRSPLVKVLDLIDLPRNVVANALFRGSGLETSDGKRTGAFGLPVVTTSDALSKLGVSNHVARGIIGFAGDVALDPLTYLGPAGWGLEVADNAGRVVKIGKIGAQSLKKGIREVSAGSQVAHEATRSLFDTLLTHAPEEIRTGDNAAKAAYLSSKAIGEVGKKSKAGQAFSYLARGLGGDEAAKGGALANELTKEGPVADAVRKFVSQHGYAAGPGIGKGGSQIAHIPFTEQSVKVPAFTRTGRAAEEDLSLALSDAPRAAEEIATPTMIRAGQLAREIQHAEQTGEDVGDKVTELAQLVERREADPIAPKNPREIFALNKLLDEANSGYLAAEARRAAPHNHIAFANADDLVDHPDIEQLSDSIQDTMKAYERYAGAVRGAVRNFAQNTPQEELLTRAAMRFLGTDDRIVGRAAFAGPDAMLRNVDVPPPISDLNSKAYRLKAKLFGEKGSSLNEAERDFRHAMGPGQRRAVNTYLAETKAALHKAFEDSGITPNGDDLDEAATLLFAMTVQKQAERGAAEAGKEIYYTKAFGSDEPAPFLKHLEDAIKNGKLSDKLGTGLKERLEQIAETHGSDLLAELRDLDTESGVLHKARAGYVPNVPTPAASKAIASGKLYTGKPVMQRTATSAAEAFQKPRSFDQVRWVSADGTPKRLFHAELDQAKRFMQNPGELEGLRREGYGDVADQMDRLVKDYQEFLDLKENRPEWHSTDPFEMNALAKEGRFSMLLNGIDPIGGFMQTNALAALANRIGSHERAVARADWRNYVNQFGLKVPEFTGATAGKDTLVAADGSQARIVTLYNDRGLPVKGAIIGGQAYRPVHGVNPNNVLFDFLGPESAQTIYHGQVASAIERMARVFEDPHPVLNGINTLTRQWKNLTLLHLSWTIFNMIGDTLNALQSGVNPLHLFNPKLAAISAKITRFAENPEKLRGITLNIRGVPTSGEEILNDLIAHKVIDGTMMEEEALKMVENRIFTMPPQASGRLGQIRPSKILSDFKDAAQRYAIARGQDGVSLADKVKAGGAVASDRYLNNFIGPWFRANQKASNYLRTQIFLSFLEDGFDATAAARKVVESQFDYSNATRVEAGLFRTAFPFYSWIRNNGAYQIKKLLERPGFTAAFPKLQNAIEEAIAGDEKVPQNLRPTWMRNALALQIGTDPEKRSALLFGGGLPAADVFQYLAPITGTAGALDFLHYFTSNLNPVISAPLQLGAGQEFFSGRTIGPDVESADLSAGEFLRNQVRPFAEIGKIGKAFRQGGISAAAGRAVLGGRIQDFSEQRLRSTKLREFKDKEQRIRAAISRAERSGDKDTSLKARVKLLEMYNAMIEAGLEEGVPKVYRKQVQELNS